MNTELITILVLAAVCILGPFLIFGIFALGAAAARGDYAREMAMLEKAMEDEG